MADGLTWACHKDQWHLTNNQHPLSKQLELPKYPMDASWPSKLLTNFATEMRNDRPCHWVRQQIFIFGHDLHCHTTENEQPKQDQTSVGHDWNLLLILQPCRSQHTSFDLWNRRCRATVETHYIRCGHALHRYGSSRFPIASQSPGNFFLNTICLRGLACEYIRS